MSKNPRIMVFNPKTGDYEPVNQIQVLENGCVLYRSDGENSNEEVK